MKHSLTFRFERLLQLLKNELQFNNRTMLIVTGAMLGILTFFILIMGFNGDDNDLRNFHAIWFSILLLLGGFIYASASFSELNTPEKRHSYLMLPASTLEKFLSKWLLSFIGYPLFLIIVYTIYSFLINFIIYQLGGEIITPFLPVDTYFKPVMLVYFGVQSLFFLGAIWYEKWEFFKIYLAYTVVSFAFTVILALITYLILGSVELNNNTVRDNGYLGWFMTGPAWNFLMYVICPGVPLVLWLTGFFKLKEKEV